MTTGEPMRWVSCGTREARMAEKPLRHGCGHELVAGEEFAFDLCPSCEADFEDIERSESEGAGS